MSHSVCPGSGLQRNQGSPGIYSTCSPATKKPAPLVIHAACVPWKRGSRLSLLCYSLAVALGKSPRLRAFISLSGKMGMLIVPLMGVAIRIRREVA